jgi:VCBS repeat-containing protein
MNTRTFTRSLKARFVAVALLLVIALVPAYAAPTATDWTTPTTGTMNGVTVTLSQTLGSPHISTDDLSGASFAAAPLSASTETIIYSTGSDWTATFSQPVSNLALYAVLWRGGNAQVSPVTYTFSEPFTILSGLDAATVSENTITLPDSGFHDGIILFTGPISSLSVDTNSATFSAQALTFALLPPNTPPVAANDSYSTNEDTALSVPAPGVLGNDSDPDGDTLTAQKASDPAHGTVSFNANGSFTYTPAANYNGPDSFTYTANDGEFDSNVATVNLTVNAVNDAPTTTNDSYSTNEDTPLTIAAPGVLSNDSDVDGNTLTAVKVSDPAHGSVTLNSNGSFTYTPAANYNGPDSFTYKANDGTADSNVATVNLTVNAVNDAPTVEVVAGGSCLSDRSGQINLTLNDADGDALTLSASSSNTNLVPNSNIVLGGTGANRTATITTGSGKTGSATITLTVSDGQTSSSVTVRVRAGGNGVDTLTGTNETDLLFGQNGDDTLNGGGGNDLLCGGNGDDRFTGGSGADHFNGGSGSDTVTDFTSGQGDTKVNIP